MADENGNFMEITINDKHGAGVNTFRVESIEIHPDYDDTLISETVQGSSVVYDADRLLGVTHVFNWG